ncbi:hypothetical protein A2154_01105 [Candidatus Gottesmanbacteria bacterium RBG_16_43_7]|uniref:Uncharacterized protein n=1 Tax=Candidatus Gottesmanbacteria bacterium RBG_16_43_7 TaxID=1798373 RepID=A0A1F5Z8N7_9BACT|nr:MAG: hypothetical protein A2154_01105 [Candidatus Gottesmanbacteria bacterium RBG_16_43_7]
MGQEIDSRIADLVEALSLYGITNASCEGHSNSGGHQHPWVNFNPGEIYPQRLMRLLEKFNQISPIQWKVREQPGGFTTILPSTYEEKFHCCPTPSIKSLYSDARPDIRPEELEELQSSAEALALFLKDWGSH